jgi:hypothetical protein
MFASVIQKFQVLCATPRLAHLLDVILLLLGLMPWPFGAILRR